MDIEAKDALLTINFKTLLREIIHYWLVILIVFAVCISGAFVYGQFISVPQYTSSATIYAVNQDDTKISTSELAISTYLTKDCCQLIVSRTVLENVINDLGLDTTYDALKSQIKVTNDDETRFINVKVTTTDPELSRKIANGVCEVSKEKIIEYLGVDWVKITDNANLPKAPSSPSLSRYLLYGFVGALIICAAFILLTYYRNEKISSAEDVENYLGICTLATIPFNRNKSAKPYGAKKR